MITARQEAEQELAYVVGNERAAQLLDAYAHELSEQIRAVGIAEWEGMSDVAKTIRQARGAAADLIDPAVEK